MPDPGVLPCAGWCAIRRARGPARPREAGHDGAVFIGPGGDAGPGGLPGVGAGARGGAVMNLPLLLSFLAVLALLAWPLARWLTRVAEGQLPGWLSPLARAEKAFYRLAGVDP